MAGLTGFDPISLGLGAVTSVLGGIFGGGAAKKAAKLQAEAAQNAAARVDRINAEQNPLITASAGEAGANALNAGQAAGARVTSDADRANALLDPYRLTGNNASAELDKNLAAGGDFNKPIGMADVTIDPGYEFRRQQGELALQRSGAARGGLLGGGAIKEALNYNSGLASQEYGSALQRLRQSTQDRYDRLFGVAGKGQEAAGAEGANLIGAGKYAGDQLVGATQYAGDRTYDATKTVANNSINATQQVNDLLTQRAQAQASGVVGSTNAMVGGISGAVNSVGSALRLKSLLKNPATSFDPRSGHVSLAGIGGTGIW